MKNRAKFSIMCLLVVVLCGGCRVAHNDEYSIGRIEMAVQFCFDHYAMHSEAPLNVDRAYVFRWNEYVELLFTKGEVGSFGDRSADYRAVLYCGITDKSEFELYVLEKVSGEVYVLIPGYTSMSAGPVQEGMVEMLFMLVGDQFKFVAEQPYDPDKTLRSINSQRGPDGDTRSIN